MSNPIPDQVFEVFDHLNLFQRLALKEIEANESLSRRFERRYLSYEPYNEFSARHVADELDWESDTFTFASGVTFLLSVGYLSIYVQVSVSTDNVRPLRGSPWVKYRLSDEFIKVSPDRFWVSTPLIFEMLKSGIVIDVKKEKYEEICEKLKDFLIYYLDKNNLERLSLRLRDSLLSEY